MPIIWIVKEGMKEWFESNFVVGQEYKIGRYEGIRYISGHGDCALFSVPSSQVDGRMINLLPLYSVESEEQLKSLFKKEDRDKEEE